MPHHIFQSSSELQNIPEAAPKASPSFSVSEKLVLYGSSSLSGVEHLRLLDGGDFAEVVRPEDARADDREHLRLDGVAVVEVDCS
jgi:hypothetical protein